MSPLGESWAAGPNAPIELIPTPVLDRDPKSHGAIYIATEMALVHNCLLRGLNAMYMQAGFISASQLQDVKDFMTFASCWIKATDNHHDTEEKVIFPEIEEFIKEPGFMDRNREQHKAFHDGLESLQVYAKETGEKPETYDVAKFLAVLDSFKEPFVTHLREEISTCKELEKYESEPLIKIWKGAESKAGDVPKDEVYPLILSCNDRTFEDGRHNFPPIPWLVTFVIKWLLARKHAGAWRFSPSDIYGQPKTMEFGPKA